MIIVVPSIPHTGTMFVYHEILKEIPQEIRNPKKGPGKIQIHIYQDRMDELYSLSAYPWIVPLRHPEKVAITWKSREKDLAELREFWWRLLDLVDSFEPHYLSIDAPNRNAQLAKINESIGLNAQTDWPIVASHGLSATLTSAERSHFVMPFVGFYEDRCAV